VWWTNFVQSSKFPITLQSLQSSQTLEGTTDQTEHNLQTL